MKKYFLFLLIGIFASFSLFAQIPAGYYDAADGKSEAELKTAMHQIVQNFINLDFSFSATHWGENYFSRTDWHPAGYFWDMYSSHQRVVYNSGLMDREHCMPRSWWSTGSGSSIDYGRANSDINNLFPADGVANGRKSNNPLGETASPRWTNDVSKVGPNSFSPAFTGIIFEPADEYKGDFARTYLYMVTSYEDYWSRWKDDGMSMLNNETYPVLKPWAIDLLLEWHRNDPVSEKERNRNDSVFVLQQNRNPFIDIPDLVEYIWGDKTNQSITIDNKATQPTLMTPSAGAAINFGRTQNPTGRTRSIPVRGIQLNLPLTVEFLENESGFFYTENQITASQANDVSGYFLPILYSPNAEGEHTAKLRISSSELAQPAIVNLRGSLTPPLPPVQPVVPTDNMEVVIFHTGTTATGAWARANLPSNFTTNAANGPYANGDFSFRNTGEYLIVEFNEKADLLQFSIFPRNAWSEGRINHLYVYEGTDRNNFDPEPIADFNNDFVTNGDGYNNTPEIPLSENTRAIKIEYIKDFQNVGINNLIIARRKECPVVSITGDTHLDHVVTSITLSASPTGDNYTYLWSTGATTPTINVTSADSFTVTVTNTINSCSTESEVFTVTQEPTTNVSKNNRDDVQLFHANGLLYVQNVSIGETVYIYDILGNLVTKKKIVDQQTIIPMERKGVFLLKVNSNVYKFVAK